MASSRELEVALRRSGFEIDPRRGKGSHKMAFFLRGDRLVIAFPFPDSGDLTPGTLASIRRAMKLTHEEFQSFLHRKLSRTDYEAILSERLGDDR